MAITLPKIPQNVEPFQLIRYIRERKCLSLEALADLSGVPYGVIYNLENGNNPIHYEEALKLSSTLNIEPDTLFDEYARFLSPGYGEKIRMIRNACNVTQEEFAEILKIRRPTLSVWEAEIGGRRPSRKSYERLKKIAVERNIDIDRLNSNPESFEDEYDTFLKGDFGKKIKYMRAAYDVTQSEFASMVGLADGSSSCMWESMAEKPLRKTFNRIRFLAEAKEIELTRLNDDPDYYRDEYSKFIERDSGAKIRYIRLKYRAFTDDFGDMLGCSGNAVCTWEKGQCIMGRQYFQALKTLAQAKGICLEELNDNPLIYQDDYEKFCVPGCGKIISCIRHMCGYSIAKFGRALGVSSSTVITWEQEKIEKGKERRPGRENYEKIKQFAKEHGININAVDAELVRQNSKGVNIDESCGTEAVAYPPAAE